jgi:predicted O-methyltransferase YrrM
LFDFGGLHLDCIPKPFTTFPDSGQMLVIACRKILYYLPRRLWKILRLLQNKFLGLVGVRPPDFACKIQTHLRADEKVALYRTVLRLPQHCIGLEVGSYLGASAAVIGSAMRHRNGQLHCVDTWENQAMDGPECETWPEFEANVRRLESVIVPHRGFSVDVAQTVSLSLDFLFVDGDHSAEAVDADLSAWLPKLKPGGIVALHDIGWADGVRKGYEKYLKDMTVWEKRLPNLLICQLRNTF